MPALAYEMGILPWDWWRLTPREFEAAALGHVAVASRRTYEVAVIVAAIYNTTRATNRQPLFTPEHFLSGGGKPAQPARLAQTPEEMLAVVKGLHVAFGGEPRQ